MQKYFEARKAQEQMKEYSCLWLYKMTHNSNQKMMMMMMMMMMMKPLFLNKHGITFICNYNNNYGQLEWYTPNKRMVLITQDF